MEEVKFEIKNFRGRKMYSASLWNPGLKIYETKTGVYKEDLDLKAIEKELRNIKRIDLSIRYAGRI